MAGFATVKYDRAFCRCGNENLGIARILKIQEFLENSLIVNNFVKKKRETGADTLKIYLKKKKAQPEM